MDKKLDNFESFIKNSMDNHEASYSGNAWESMQEAMSSNPNGADGFESFVKKSLDNHEAPYTSAAWKSVASLLNKSAVPFYKTKGFIAAVSAVIITGVVLFSLPKNNTETKEIVSNDVVKEKAISTDSEKVTVKNEAKTNKEIIVNEQTAHNDNVINNENKALPITELNLAVNERDNSSVEDKTDDNPLKETQTKEDVSTETPAETNGVESSLVTDYRELFVVSFDTKLNACEEETLNLTPREINKELTYQWLLNGKSISKEATAKVTLSKLGENNIDLIAYLNGKRVGSRAKVINVSEKPKNTIGSNENKYSLINSRSFTTNNDVKAVTWSFGDGKTSNELAAKHSYKKQGKYTLSYHLTNNTGCSASYSKDIIVKGYYNIRPDHGFSPDGDGSLDEFLPEELKLINQPFEMVVYTRSREIVYKTTSINNPWNGRDLEGNMVPFGVYVWVINITNEHGEEELYPGTVTKASN